MINVDNRRDKMNNIQKYKADFDGLITLGEQMRKDLAGRHEKGESVVTDGAANLEGNYQNWYTESCALIKQLLPDRLFEFEQLYKGDGRRREIDSSTYNIQDWLNGVRASTNLRGEKAFNDFAAVAMRFQTQYAILRALGRRFESSLFDIRQLVQADLFDSELDAAKELTGRGFLRAAGAVSGVVLEKHLSQVTENHGAKTRKKNPTIGDFNDLLKDAGVLDVPSWRQIQRLGDIRNLCDHNREREPTRDEVDELIGGVEKLTKTLF